MTAWSSGDVVAVLSRRDARSKALRLRRYPSHDGAGLIPRHVMTSDPGRIGSAARFFYDIHRGKKTLPPTPPEIPDAGIDDAYDIQEALQALFVPERGEIAGYKIAITTPVMQKLMAIDQ